MKNTANVAFTNDKTRGKNTIDQLKNPGNISKNR